MPSLFRIRHLRRWLVCGSLLATGALGCIYNVRDMAFVDFGAPPYRLYCYVRDTTPPPAVANLSEIAHATLQETNVRFEMVNVSAQPAHPALEYRRFWNIRSEPALVLVSPKGRSLAIPVAGSTIPSRQQIWRALDGVAASATRDEILKHIITDYAVVVLVEGRDARANAAARQAVNTAARKVAGTMHLLPKQNGKPPAVIVISPAAFSRERVLLWSLGVDNDQADQPAAAVLYGMGRRIGPVLTGKQIQPVTLYNMLSTIGLSCECGLDRSYLLGLRIPLRWDQATRSRVTSLLGFDPENPMVRTEMSMIMSMGPSNRQGSPDQYSEQALPVQGRLASPRLAPAEFQQLASVATGPDLWGLPLKTTLLTLAGGILLVLGGAALILLRARKQIS